MTEGQVEFTVASLIVLLVLFIWMTVYYYRKTGSPDDTGGRLSDGESRMDRDEVVRRVALMDEVSSKKVYKKVYQITDDELAAHERKGKH